MHTNVYAYEKHLSRNAIKKNPSNIVVNLLMALASLLNVQMPLFLTLLCDRDGRFELVHMIVVEDFYRINWQFHIP